MSLIALKTAPSKKISLDLDSGIPLPEASALFDRIDWDTIKVGQSFAVTEEKFGAFPADRLRVAVNLVHKTSALRFSIRKNQADEFRCWRVS